MQWVVGCDVGRTFPQQQVELALFLFVWFSLNLNRTMEFSLTINFRTKAPKYLNCFTHFIAQLNLLNTTDFRISKTIFGLICNGNPTILKQCSMLRVQRLVALFLENQENSKRLCNLQIYSV